MKIRFTLLIALLIFLFGAWLVLAYLSAASKQAKLDDISQLPIYAYVADTTKVAPILAELKGLPGIKEVVHESAMQAATELIEAYGLPLQTDMLVDYSFPDVITINLQPTKQALAAKPIIISTLRSIIPEGDIDSQASAYSNLSAELKLITQRNIALNIFAAILLLLVLVFSRLSFELHTLLQYQGRKHSVLDKLRHEEQGVRHTWAMLLFPLPICVLLYFILVFALRLPQQIPYWVFIAQFASALIATLITHFSLHTFEHEVALNENPVEVVSSPITEETL